MAKAGGQAVFEGVMMRGDRYAVAVRTPAGDIQVRTWARPTVGHRGRTVPVVRGVLALAEALALGVRAMRWSAVHGLGRPGPRRTPVERLAPMLTVVAVLAAVVTVPAYAAEWLVGGWDNAVVDAVVENIVAIGIVVASAAATGRLSAVRRLFENHGAEHKVVAAYEAGVELTPENAVVHSTRHIRCGTSLLLVVGVVSGIVSVVLDHHALPGLLASPLALVPLVAGVSAELQLRAAANVHRSWVRTLVRPGLALQRLTTREPDLDQLEVAIVALKAAYGELDTTTATQPSSDRTVAVPA